jgi:hypothetical protein
MSKLQQIMRESKKLDEHNDCAVRAVTAVSGMPYRYVHQLFLRYGRHRRGRTPFSVTLDVLRDLQMEAYPCYRLQHKAKTVKSLKKVLPAKGRFLIHTRGHLLAAVDGEIIDWTDGRKHRIKSIERVTF